MPNKEEIKKAVESLVDETLNTSEEKVEEKEEVVEKSEEAKADAVEKSMPVALDENGGKDKIKSGTPYTEQGEGKPASSDASHSKTQKGEAKKSEEDEEKEEDKVEKAEDKKEEEKKAKKCMMKKSIDELSEHLTEDELELIKAWRAELEDEKEEKAEVEEPKAEDITKSVQEAVSLQLESINKALSEKDELIKSLNEKVEKLSEKPAYDKRSLENLETIEKAGTTDEPVIQKAQILDKMLELQTAGKGVRAQHVAEFEATGNISDPIIKNLVMNSFTN